MTVFMGQGGCMCDMPKLIAMTERVIATQKQRVERCEIGARSTADHTQRGRMADCHQHWHDARTRRRRHDQADR